CPFFAKSLSDRVPRSARVPKSVFEPRLLSKWAARVSIPAPWDYRQGPTYPVSAGDSIGPSRVGSKVQRVPLGDVRSTHFSSNSVARVDGGFGAVPFQRSAMKATTARWVDSNTKQFRVGVRGPYSRVKTERTIRGPWRRTRSSCGRSKQLLKLTPT